MCPADRAPLIFGVAWLLVPVCCALCVRWKQQAVADRQRSTIDISLDDVLAVRVLVWCARVHRTSR